MLLHSALIRSYSLLCLVGLMVYGQVKAQYDEPADMYFKQVTSEDGLSHNSISSILQDQDGVIWIGTFDGLNRYDGRSIQVYHHDETDPTSLSNSTILDMIESSNGDLWMTTYRGLNRYNKKTGKFDRYLSRGMDNRYIQLEEDHEGNIWLATTTSGLIKVSWPPGDTIRSPDNYQVHTYRTEDGLIDDKTVALAIHPSSPDILWIGSTKGLVSMNIKEEKIYKIPLSEDIPSLANGMNIVKIFQDTDGHLWLGTTSHGLLKYHIDTEQVQQYLDDPSDQSSISSNRVSDISQDTEGNIWIVSYGNGVSKYDHLRDEFVRMGQASAHRGSLQTDNTIRILCTSDGNIWIGTSGHGLHLFIPQQFRFRYFTSDETDPQSLSSQNISTIGKDDQGDLWVGTHATGINRLRIHSDLDKIDEITFIQADKISGLSANRIATIKRLDSNLLLIGYIGANASIYDISRSELRPYFYAKNDLAPLANRSVFCATLDHQQNLWIGAKDGLYRYDDTQAQMALESDIDQRLPGLTLSGCNEIVEDRHRLLWIATAANGLIKYDPQTKSMVGQITSIEGRSGLKSNAILTILYDGQDYIWLGTWGGGLSRVDINTNEIVTYTRSDGLANDVVYSIEQPTDSQLWMSTNKGISKFDITTETFSNYTTKDGLQGEEFNSRASYFDAEKDVLYFGGVNGLNVFRPEEAKNGLGSIDVYISELIRYRSEGTETRTYLEPNLKDKESITLSYQDHTLAFHISVVNYTAPEKIELRYLLEGLNTSWISIGQDSEIRLANINPGTYQLRLQAYTGDQLIDGASTSMQIIVRPPWWYTWQAYVCYVLLTISGFYIFYKYRLYQLKKYRDLREKISRDLHDDVGSLLSGVAMQSEMMAMDMSEQKKSGMDEISELSRDAMESMRDIVWAIDSRKDKYENLIDRMRAFTENQLSKKEISHAFTTKGFASNTAIDPASRQNIYLILKEAITNIVKHSNATHVAITFTKSRSKVQLTIFDNGDTQSSSPSDGLGIMNMHQRAQELGGYITIDTSRGYHLTLTIG